MKQNIVGILMTTGEIEQEILKEAQEYMSNGLARQKQKERGFKIQ